MAGPYSDEVNSIVAYVESLGIPHRVTDINTPGVHTKTSYHYAVGTNGKGLAVDFAGSAPGTSAAMVAQMATIWRAFRPFAPQLAELFFNSLDTSLVVKDGVWRGGLQTLGKTTWDAHRNHVHVALKKGQFLTPAPVQPASTTQVPARTETVPIPVHDYEEAATKTTMIHIGPLDQNGRGWADWQPGLGRDPIVVGVVQHGPSPVDDGYWEQQERVNLSAQPRGTSLRVVVRGGKPGDTVSAWLTVA